jgi:hypothetical protein
MQEETNVDNLLWIVVAAVAFVVMLSLALPGKRSSRRQRSRAFSSRVFNVRTSAYLPYERQPYLLTRAERTFDEVLRRAVGTNLVVFPKVRLADVVRVQKGAPGYYTHFNRISGKHIDFLVCTCDTLSPALVVELDDASHERPERRERDDFVDDTLAAARLPILHIPCRAGYDAAEIAAKVQMSLIQR